jgi:hypothetical protein
VYSIRGFSSFDRIMKIVGWVQPANFLGGQVPKARLSSYEISLYIKHFLKKEIVIHPAPLNLKNPSSLSDSKLVVEQQLMHFLELVYLENWKNIKKKQIFLLNPEDIGPNIQDLSKISAFSWWSHTLPQLTFKQYPVRLLLKYILFFFINNVSPGWFYNIRSRRITAGRTRSPIRFYFNTLRKSEFGYKSQNGLFLYYFLLNYKARITQPHLANKLKQNIFMCYLDTLHLNRVFVETSLTPEIMLKQMFLFLIPADYVKGHYFLFYNIKKELSVYLGIEEHLFNDPTFFKQLHNILLNYIYYKFYFFIMNKKENPFFGSYHFNVLESKFLAYANSESFFQHGYLIYHIFYRLFFGSKHHKQNRVLITRLAMWEIASPKYHNLINFIPVKVKYKKYSISQGLSELVSRISQKIWSGAIYYEYRFGKIKIRTKARWTREKENEIQTQERLERLWYSFFWQESIEYPTTIQNIKDLKALNIWKSANYERLLALTAFMQHSNRIQRKLRFDAQMLYVRSLRYGKRKWMFVKLSMKHWW